MISQGMMSVVGVLLLLLSPIVLPQESVEVLTNEKVVTMVKAGLPSGIIVNKIHASKTNFNSSTDEFIRLQQAHLPSDVINAMVEASTKATKVTASTDAGDLSKTDSNDPASAHDAEIYLFGEKDGKRQMIQLEPSISTQSKSGGFFKSAMTYGIAKLNLQTVLANSSARLQLQSSPGFLFLLRGQEFGAKQLRKRLFRPQHQSLTGKRQQSAGRAREDITCRLSEGVQNREKAGIRYPGRRIVNSGFNCT
jgi:hypothetical protein